MAATAVVMGILLVLDVVVGVAYSYRALPPLLAGAGVSVGVVVAVRRPLLGTCLASVVSLGVTLAAGRTGAGPLVVGSGSALPGMAEVAGLAFVLGVSLRTLSRVATVPGILLVGAAFVGILGRGGDDGFQPLVVLAVALVACVATGVGMYLRWMDHDRRRDLDRAREADRLAIARELHDVVAHHVTGIVVQAQAAQAVWEARPAEARIALAKIEVAGSEALGSMRRLVETLRADDPGSAAQTSTVEELHRLASHARDLGLPVQMDLDGLPDDLDPEVAASLQRIVGEAITNAQRHAVGATGVVVQIGAHGGRLVLQVSDDGQATEEEAARGSGYGLVGMNERAAALGGTLRAGPGRERGWLVEADIPLVRT
jgi:signal transduction histidine kinase